jgi:pentapeptide MXKDX repeat protein
MKLVTTLVMSLALAAGTAVAQDKKDAMKPAAAPTAKECQDYMDMAKKDPMKKDAKKESACADMMKKADAMKKDAPKK